MKTALKFAAIAITAFGVAGGAALAQAASNDGSVAPVAASPMPGFSTNGTPRGNALNSVPSSDSSTSSSSAQDSSAPALQPRTDRN